MCAGMHVASWSGMDARPKLTAALRCGSGDESINRERRAAVRKHVQLARAHLRSRWIDINIFATAGLSIAAYGGMVRLRCRKSQPPERMGVGLSSRMSTARSSRSAATTFATCRLQDVAAATAWLGTIPPFATADLRPRRHAWLGCNWS